MELVRFIRSGARKSSLTMLVLAGLAGMMGAALLELIDTVASALDQGNEISWSLIGVYSLGIFVLYLASQRSLVMANTLIERLLDKLRLRMVGKLRRCELRFVEELGRTELTNRLSQEISHLSQMFPLLVNACRDGLLVLFCALYIGTISVPAFTIIVITIGIAIRVYEDYRIAGLGLFQETSSGQEELLESFEHIVDGCKEIRLHTERNDDLYKSYCERADHLRNLAQDMGKGQVFLMMFGNLVLYSVLAMIVFFLSKFISGFNDELFKLTTAFLFCFGSLSNVVGVLPIFQRAEGGLKNVFELERELDEHLSTDELDRVIDPTRFQGFQQIQLQQTTFSYENSEGQSTFSVGPLDLTINRGELVFIVGGNGAGKSTALKLLTGLYPRDGGALEVDGAPVDTSTDRAELRELFSSVFADFHLFDKLYGCEGADPDRVNDLIAQVELQDKVTFKDGAFSDTRLSTGQKKRLALVAALAEDREIYVFDEWTADQDVHFREHFYSKILPQLKQQGKTVVAVTHDDRYWHLADRLVRMELGMKVSVVNDPNDS